ncbi:MAG: pantetheine-phosphate adenylyltransferase [Chlamydiae bacterium]|nr:pantetheine-phosphate adenylyltransferase [Chlamydiota bacterium]
MKRALFPGMFDPPSLGHLDIIKRALHICDSLVIGIGENVLKNSLFSNEEKLEFMKEITKGMANVEICLFSGLVVDFAKKKMVHYLIRGLRTLSDYAYEMQMAISNRNLGNIETIFLIADQKYSHISATLIRELIFQKANLTGFVPEQIIKMVSKKQMRK